jgi:hypothetical protein
VTLWGVIRVACFNAELVGLWGQTKRKGVKTKIKQEYVHGVMLERLEHVLHDRDILTVLDTMRSTRRI